MDRNKEIKNIIISMLGAFIQAFGVYNIHSVAPITEGGLLGLELLLQYWFKISPAISALVLSSVCYFAGWKMFGKKFLIYSGVSIVSYSVSYAILEQFPRIYPQIAQMPFLAAVVGAAFIGIGAGLCVRIGGATAGDDALAMTLSRKYNIKIQWIYLGSDVIILALALTYIPLGKILYSLLSVFISGQIVGLMQKNVAE